MQTPNNPFKVWREQQGLSHEDVLKRIRDVGAVPPVAAYLYQIEEGYRRPSPAKARQLAGITGGAVVWHALIDWYDDNEPALPLTKRRSSSADAPPPGVE